MDIDGSSSGTGLGSSGGLSAVVAAGPFCLSDDLAFEPLHELLQELKLRPPNLVVGDIWPAPPQAGRQAVLCWRAEEL
jgi:hypothetical protein